MTNRYELLVESISKSNQSIVFVFVLALAFLLGYAALRFIPARYQRTARNLYIVYGVMVYVLLLVYPFVMIYFPQ